eukprot:SAG31_NODE_220_length_19925_cov_3.630939_1_plen_218_part_00
MPPTEQQLLSLDRVASPALSPDGRQVLFTVTSTDWARDAFVSQLHLAACDGSASLQLTSDPTGATNGQWSPCGRWISFIASRRDDGMDEPTSKGPQIYLIRPSGGEAFRLTAAPQGVLTFAWSPDSKSIAFVAKPAESKHMKERKEAFGQYKVVRNDYEHAHIFTVAVGSENLPLAGQQRTSGTDFTVSTGFGTGPPFSFSPNGDRIAFVATSSPGM